MNNDKERVEVFLQGKKIAEFKTLDELDAFLDKSYNTYGNTICESCGGNIGYYVYFNESTKVSKCLSWKTFTGFYGKDKVKIYAHSYLIDDDGNEFSLVYVEEDKLYLLNKEKSGWYLRQIPDNWRKNYTYEYLESEKELRKLTVKTLQD